MHKHWKWSNKWNQMQKLTRQFKAVSPMRKTALIECIMTINYHRTIEHMVKKYPA